MQDHLCCPENHPEEKKRHSFSQKTKTTKTTDNFADNAPTGKTLFA